jgi:hypothetical protein
VETLEISVDGGPFMVLIHLGQKADPRHVQELLDGVS